jgi:hypothetical protein
VEDPIGNLNSESTPSYRIIDKADIFDVAKMKNLSTYQKDSSRDLYNQTDTGGSNPNSHKHAG